jgi:hypothetical protein
MDLCERTFDICISIKPCRNQFWVLWQWPHHGPLLAAMNGTRIAANMSSLKSHLFVVLQLNHYNVTSINCTSLLQSSYRLKLTPTVYFVPYRRRMMYKNIQQSMAHLHQKPLHFFRRYFCVFVMMHANSLACSFIMIYHAYSGSYLRGLGSAPGRKNVLRV